MNVQGLRIGNWIINGNNHYIKVGYHEIRYGILHPGTQNNYEPIALTSDILEKAAFSKDEGSNIYKLTLKYADTNYPCTLQQTADGFQVCRGGVGAITAPVEYLHQLQNLIFSLTGQELEIKI